jgi:xanthine dehydrogenase YagR molybdenum-binding subunit
MPEIVLAPSPAQSPAHVRHGSNIGQPLTRQDGILKVTGAARYAADHHPPGMLYAVLAVSSIARGRVAFLDVQAAKAHPGVVDVMTPANRPALAQDPDEKTNPFMLRLDVLQNDRVRYANQTIAVVIAETLEAATEGAALLSPRYETEPARIGLDAAESFAPSAVGIGGQPEAHRGDVEAGIAAASRRLEATYETPPQYHNPMEPHAIVATWDGDALSIDTPSQGLVMAQGRIAGLFGISPDKIYIRSPFLGGGFGCKGFINGPQVLGIMAARMVGRPVKLVLRREQMYGPTGYRAPTRQTLRLGAGDDGRLTALDHRTRTASSTFDDFFEPASGISHVLYASEAISTSYEAVRMDAGTPGPMRAPGAHSSVRSTRWRMPAGWIRWSSGSGIMPRSSRYPASRSPRRRCAIVTSRAPSASAGRPASSRPGRCAIATACSSGGAWARQRFTHSCSRPRQERCCARTAAESWRPERKTWARAPGPRWRRSRRTASGST